MSHRPPALVASAMPVLVALVVAALVLVIVAPADPAMATSRADIDVHGDDAHDRYEGTGGLVLPGSVDRRTRTEVASCGGCEWRLATPCVASPTDPALGTPFEAGTPCLSVVRGCPGGDRLLRAWFRDRPGSWRDLGLLCIGRSGPVTVAEVDRLARERFIMGMPDQAPVFQPSVNAVTQIPVVFSSGQPGGIRESEFAVVGIAVRLRAQPTWTWEFGDGSLVRTQDPGGSYPSIGVTHAYRTSGRFAVVVTTEWSATFTVAGLGPFPVTEPVSQQRRVAVVVGEGRALLRP